LGYHYLKKTIEKQKGVKVLVAGPYISEGLKGEILEVFGGSWRRILLQAVFPEHHPGHARKRL